MLASHSRLAWAIRGEYMISKAVLFSGLGSDAKLVEAATWCVQVLSPLWRNSGSSLTLPLFFLFVSQVSIALLASLGGE